MTFIKFTQKAVQQYSWHSPRFRFNTPLSIIWFWGLSVSLFAQTPEIQWQKQLGGASHEGAQSVQQTSDGGYIIAGITHSSNSGDVGSHHNPSNPDIWIVKLSAIGAIQWQKVLGGTGTDYARSIQQTSDGGYILAGSTNSNNSGDVGENHGYYDAWIVKLSATGTIQWQKVLGGTDGDGASFIQQTSDGGYIVAGGTSSSNTGDVGENHGLYSSDAWIVKLSATGTIQWQKVLGGTGDDGASFIQQTSDGGYVVAGSTTSSNSGDVGVNHGSNDYWVVKLNSTGAILWQKVLGGDNYETAYSIRQTSDGGYIVAGSTYSNNTGDVGVGYGDNDWWIVKLSNVGDIQWQRVFGGTGYDYASSVQQTSDGGYLVGGYFEPKGKIYKLDGNGWVVWSKNLESFNVTDLKSTSDGGVIAVGASEINENCAAGNNHGSTDFFVAKLSAPCLGVNLTATITPPTCLVPTGTITVTAPTTGYTYSFDNGATFQTSRIKSGLLPNSTHSIIAKANTTGCKNWPSIRYIPSITPPPAAPIASQTTAPTCTTPTATITVSEPLTGHTYSFDNGVTFQTSRIKSGLAPNTTFAIKVKNTTTGCISTATSVRTSVITAPPAIPAATVVQPTCTTPTATVTVSNPTTGHTFSFDNGVTFQASTIKSGLAPNATYLVKVKSNTTGCVSLARSVVVNAISANPAPPHIKCDRTADNVPFCRDYYGLESC